MAKQLFWNSLSQSIWDQIMIHDYLQNLECLFQNINCALEPWEDFIDVYVLDTDTWKIGIFVMGLALLF